MPPRTMTPFGILRDRLGDQLTTTLLQPKPTLVEVSAKEKKKCMFCGRKEISEALYGLLYQLDDIVIHQFCILLSSESVQNGDDHDGVWGFLLKDIKAELARGSKVTCVYCKKHGATISCGGKKCRKNFHLPCGLENGSMHLYFGDFKSFCQQHRKKQTKDLKVLQNSSPIDCSICMEIVLPTALQPPILAPCCNQKTWFHRQCVQNLAISLGYLFKCPLCRNVDLFKKRMLTLGIYIPSRDASWETEPNAFAELRERHNTCDAVKCLCTYGLKRKYQQETGEWEIVLCHTCASTGTHRKCSALEQGEPWLCTLCTNITGNVSETKKRKRSVTGEEQSVTNLPSTSITENQTSITENHTSITENQTSITENQTSITENQTSGEGSSNSFRVVNAFRNAYTYFSHTLFGSNQSVEQGEQDSNMLP